LTDFPAFGVCVKGRGKRLRFCKLGLLALVWVSILGFNVFLWALFGNLLVRLKVVAFSSLGYNHGLT
jgi:hypothetical protein